MKNFFSFSYVLRRKYHRLLAETRRRYRKKQVNLSQEQKKRFEERWNELYSSLKDGDRKKWKEKAADLELCVRTALPKTSLEKSVHTVSGIAIALFLAILIRLVWFELYEIPTGSMRPTLKEQDRLIVSKTTFGINVPLRTDHFYFSEALVQRSGIFVFTGENMDIRDVDTLYFYVFPGKKMYIKRLMGKPGDTLYFYGGLLYGVDASGNDISHQLQPGQLEKIDHVPFLYFEGKTITAPYPVNGVYSPVIIKHFNEPVAKLQVADFGKPTGKLVKNSITQMLPPRYGDLWGMKNFGMARLLTKQQVQDSGREILGKGNLYLEIRHDPDLHNLQILRDEQGRFRPVMQPEVSFIPLQEHHLRTLFSNLYTVRFVVRNGKAFSYGRPINTLQKSNLPALEDVPDGTYEFYYGKAYKIVFGGIATELDPSHPLYRFSEERIALFYNLGTEFDTRLSPENRSGPYYPRRYVYFRNGTFYALGAPLLSKDDPTLQEFLTRENEKRASAPANRPYLPFIDHGPPLLSDGSPDIDFIRHYGFTIPARSYLGLGDNHAVSSDSRDFGFIPEDNIRGAPDYIFWPPGKDFGRPNQPPYPFFNLPRTVVWIFAAVSIGIGVYIRKKRNELPPPY